MVLAAPSLPEAAAQGEGAFLSIMNGVLPRPLVVAFVAGIVVAQYLCGLATVTSASRMAFAFARDGGLPFSQAVRWVCPRRRSPAVAIWMVATAAVLFTLYTPVYATITAVCTIFLYISYVLPTALGAWAYGRTWTAMGPWNLGPWYRPLAVLSVAGCAGTDRHRHAAAQRTIGLGRRRGRGGAGAGVVRRRAPPIPRSAPGGTWWEAAGFLIYDSTSMVSGHFEAFRRFRSRGRSPWRFPTRRCRDCRR